MGISFMGIYFTFLYEIYHLQMSLFGIYWVYKFSKCFFIGEIGEIWCVGATSKSLSLGRHIWKWRLICVFWLFVHRHTALKLLPGRRCSENQFRDCVHTKNVFLAYYVTLHQFLLLLTSMCSIITFVYMKLLAFSYFGSKA